MRRKDPLGTPGSNGSAFTTFCLTPEPASFDRDITIFYSNSDYTGQRGVKIRFNNPEHIIRWPEVLFDSKEAVQVADNLITLAKGINYVNKLRRITL